MVHISPEAPFDTDGDIDVQLVCKYLKAKQNGKLDQWGYRKLYICMYVCNNFALLCMVERQSNAIQDWKSCKRFEGCRMSRRIAKLPTKQCDETIKNCSATVHEVSVVTMYYDNTVIMNFYIYAGTWREGVKFLKLVLCYSSMKA